MEIPPIDDITSIRELRIADDLPPNAAEMNGWPTNVFYIKCISTTLIVSKAYFQDIFNKLKKGDTFKAVVHKHDDIRLSHFKYFLRIDSGNL
ncbi:hypothetical protein N9954_02790 [Maribacter sp.]|nr:hypothetical protein [Maribacter sp.]